MKTYQVRHYQQSIDNSEQYDLAETETVTAKTGEHLTLAVKAYEGFTAPEKQQVTVEGDGRTTVIYRYTRNVHTLTLKNYDGKTDKTVEARYEMSIPKPTRAGYAFAGWYTDAKCTKEYKANMPDQDLSRYGLIGSPTSVEKMFAPEESEKQVYLEGTAKEKADKLVALLTGKKII